MLKFSVTTLFVLALSSSAFSASITSQSIKQKQINLITKQLQSITDQRQLLEKVYLLKSKVRESQKDSKIFAQK